MRTLNLGCGANKIPGSVNMDIEPSLEPDVIADFTEPLPFEAAEFDEVYLFHTIEHVQKKFHQGISDIFAKAPDPRISSILALRVKHRSPPTPPLPSCPRNLRPKAHVPASPCDRSVPKVSAATPRTHHRAKRREALRARAFSDHHRRSTLRRSHRD